MKKKTNSVRNGLLFGFTAFLAIGGPMLINHAGEQTYPVPEAAVLTLEDTEFVLKQTQPFCSGQPVQTAEPTWPTPPPGQEVPVVLYHRITKYDKPSHEVTRPAMFRDHMDWLKAQGYEPISVDRLQKYMAGKGTIPAKPIVITFDDGFKDNIEAAKYLKKLDFGATFYIVSTLHST